MIDDRLGWAVASWLKSTDPIAPDSVVSVRRVIDELKGSNAPVGRRWGIGPSVPRPAPTESAGHRRDRSTQAAIASLVVAVVLLVVAGGAVFLSPQDDDRLGTILAAPSPSPVVEPTVTPTTARPSDPSTSPDDPSVSRFGETRVLTRLDAGADPTSLTQGFGDQALLVDRASGTVTEVDIDGYRRVIARAGQVADGSEDGRDVLADPRAATRAGDSIVIVGSDGAYWTWRRSGPAGYLQPRWVTEARYLSGPATVAPGTAILAGAWRSSLDYDVYAVDPASTIIRHSNDADDTGFGAPQRMIERTDIADRVVDLFVDDRVFVLGKGSVDAFSEVRRLGAVRADESFALEVPPGPPVDYRFIHGTGGDGDGDGALYLFDAASQRIDVFDKGDGAFIGSWTSGQDQPAMNDVRGMYVKAGDDGHVVATWMTPQAVYESALFDGPLPTNGRAAGLAPTAREPGKRRLDFDQNGLRLEADAMRIDVGGQVFDGSRRIAFHNFMDVDEGELGLFWYERGIQNRLQFFLGTDETHWWIDEVQTYDGVRGDGQYIYYRGLAPLTRTPIGEALEGDLDLRNTGAKRARFREPGSARLRIDGMRLTAFQPGTRPGGLTGCERVSDEEARGHYSRSGYLTAEGDPLEGIEEMTPAEVEAVLKDLGLCYMFVLTHPYPDAGEDPDFDSLRRDAWERWCTAPPEGRIEGEGRSQNAVLLVPDTYSDEPGSIVRVHVRSERGDWAEPPLAGWGCPAR